MLHISMYGILFLVAFIWTYPIAANTSSCAAVVSNSTTESALVSQSTELLRIVQYGLSLNSSLMTVTDIKKMAASESPLNPIAERATTSLAFSLSKSLDKAIAKIATLQDWMEVRAQLVDLLAAFETQRDTVRESESRTESFFRFVQVIGFDNKTLHDDFIYDEKTNSIILASRELVDSKKIYVYRISNDSSVRIQTLPLTEDHATFYFERNFSGDGYQLVVYGKTGVFKEYAVVNGFVNQQPDVVSRHIYSPEFRQRNFSTRMARAQSQVEILPRPHRLAFSKDHEFRFTVSSKPVLNFSEESQILSWEHKDGENISNSSYNNGRTPPQHMSKLPSIKGKVSLVTEGVNEHIGLLFAKSHGEESNLLVFEVTPSGVTPKPKYKLTAHKSEEPIQLIRLHQHYGRDLILAFGKFVGLKSQSTPGFEIDSKTGKYKKIILQSQRSFEQVDQHINTKSGVSYIVEGGRKGRLSLWSLDEKLMWKKVTHVETSSGYIKSELLELEDGSLGLVVFSESEIQAYKLQGDELILSSHFPTDTSGFSTQAIRVSPRGEVFLGWRTNDQWYHLYSIYGSDRE